jgi:hypothetical protein
MDGFGIGIGEKLPHWGAQLQSGNSLITSIPLAVSHHASYLDPECESISEQ